MQTTENAGNLLNATRKVLMVIGATLFIALGSATFAQAGTAKAAHETNNPQPELQVIAKLK